MKVPIMVNTGKLKINNTGGNISSAQSVASGKVNPQIQEQNPKKMERNLKIWII